MVRALIIRADASVEIGAGHVMRCIALAQEWKLRGGSVCFVSAATSEFVQTRIIQEGFEFQEMCSQAATMEDAKELLRIAEQNETNVVVLDGYQFKEEYHDTVASSGLITLAIEDGFRLQHCATSFVLDQNHGTSVTRYPNVSENTHLLLGTDYALLRREFLDANRNQERFDQKGAELRCLVTLGGADPNNVTDTVIKGLLLLNDTKMKVRILLGGMNPHAMSLEQLISGDPRFTLLQNTSNMAEHYAWANFAIAAGGSSNWEMCYFGIPRIVVVIADNQRLIAEQLAHEGIAIRLGESSSLPPEQVANAVKTFWTDKNLLNHATRRSKELVDGLGAIRVVDHLLNAICN